MTILNHVFILHAYLVHAFQSPKGFVIDRTPKTKSESYDAFIGIKLPMSKMSHLLKNQIILSKESNDAGVKLH